MNSSILYILSVISIYLLFGGMAFIRLRLFTTMKTKTIIIIVALMTIIAMVVVITA